MAGETPVIDPRTGLYTTGRFAGFSAEDVANYAETLETASRGGKPPAERPPAQQATPPAQAPPPQNTPEARLAAANNARMDPLNTGVVLRMIQDDMDAFKATVTDYDKYAEKIEEIKRNIPPHQLTQKGLHRQIYINVKSSDPEFAARLMEPGAPAAEGEVPPETPPAAKTVPVAAHTRTAPQAKPVPPALPPTPGSRTSAPPPAAATTKLKPNEKIIKFCRATGQDVTQYLSRLEQMGQTQADIDAPSTATQSAPRSVYDRSLAKR